MPANHYFTQRITQRACLPQKKIKKENISYFPSFEKGGPVPTSYSRLVTLFSLLGVTAVVGFTVVVIGMFDLGDSSTKIMSSSSKVIVPSFQLVITPTKVFRSSFPRQVQKWQLTARQTIAIQAPSAVGNLLSSDFDCRTLKTSDFHAVGLPNLSYRGDGDRVQGSKYKCQYRAQNGTSLLIFQAADSLESALSMGKPFCQLSGALCTNQKLIINSYPAVLQKVTSNGSPTASGLYILDPDEDEVITIFLTGPQDPQKLVAYAKAHVF